MDYASTLKYIEAVIKSPKTQFSCALSFGFILYAFYEDIEVFTRLVLTGAAILPACALLYGIGEWLIKYCDSCRKQNKKIGRWNSLSPQELGFVQSYIDKDTRTINVKSVKGSIEQAGLIELLVQKEILYLPVNHTYPDYSTGKRIDLVSLNINDDAFEFFKKKFNDEKS